MTARPRVQTRPSPQWDDFVEAHPRGTVYHSRAWLTAVRESLGCATYFVERRADDGQLLGVLPLVRQRSLVFGDRLTSVAFGSYGGPLSVGEGVTASLMEEAPTLAAELGSSRIEVRDSEPLKTDWRCSTDKVTFDLPLPGTMEPLLKQLGAKLRSQIRRADRETVGVRVGGVDLVQDFYRVFAENMRDLGTPVYPARFFGAVARHLADRCRIVVVDWNGVPSAAALLLKTGARVEVPWAASTGASRPISLNMRLYAELLKVSMEWGAEVFDFGRCSVDSGTYRFKKQWGAVPRQLYWYRWRKHPVDAGTSTSAQGLGLAPRIWQKLPLMLANRLGPLISPSLPW